MSLKVPKGGGSAKGAYCSWEDTEELQERKEEVERERQPSIIWRFSQSDP